MSHDETSPYALLRSQAASYNSDMSALYAAPLQGRTVIVGPKYSGKTLLTAALAVQADMPYDTEVQLVAPNSDLLIITNEAHRINFRYTAAINSRQANFGERHEGHGASIVDVFSLTWKGEESVYVNKFLNNASGSALIVVDETGHEHVSWASLGRRLAGHEDAPKNLENVAVTTLPDMNDTLVRSADNLIRVEKINRPSGVSIHYEGRATSEEWMHIRGIPAPGFIIL